MSTVDGLQLRREFGRKLWLPPVPYGDDGWRMVARDHTASVLVSTSPSHVDPDDHREWTHASLARSDKMPDYYDLVQLHRAVWGETGWAYQCFAPVADHVNLREHCLHLWGLADGSPVLPNFGALGTI